MIKLSYIKSDNRQYNIERSLSLIKTEITKEIKNAKSVVIVPDCIVADNQLAATHLDALDVLLAFIRPYVKCQITLAGSCSYGSTVDAFKNYGYYKLQDFYDLAVIDLNTEDFKSFSLFNAAVQKWTARISQPLLDADYIISICPPKTDKNLFYTGVVNNVISNSIFKPQKKKSFFSLKGESDDRNIAYSNQLTAVKNIQVLGQKLKTHLSIIDGFETMEGDGPINGQLVPGHFCIAGTEPDNVDVLACQYLGLNIDQVKYLKSTSKWSDYFVIGDDWQKNTLDIRLPETFNSTGK